MRFQPGPASRARIARVWTRFGSGSLLIDARRRRHLAVLVVAIAITVFGYVVLQPRKVRLQADGRELVVTTHMANDTALLQRAGIDLRPGDRVTALAASGADVLRVERARSVTLHADGATYQMRTHAETIDQLLAEAAVAIGDRDSVVQDGELVSVNAPVDPPRLFASRTLADAAQGSDNRIVIDVRRAVPFTISEDGATTESSSSRQTVAQALREAGIGIGPGDAVTPGADAPLDAGLHIEVRHAKAVTVTLPHDHTVLYTLAATVAEALSSAGITIPAGAYIDPPPETAVRAGMFVRVVQLSESSDVEREFIESGTVYKPDPDLRPGETRTVPGHDGVHVRRYDVAYVNGEEAGRTLVEEYDDPAPMDTIIYYPVQKGRTGEPPPAPSAGTTLRVYATWYNPASSGRAPSDPAYGHTATGAIVTYGIVAVDPDVIPLGTKMFIPGYGYAVAADTGGAVKGYLIDLGFPDGVQVDWQSHWVEITILS
jgi:uncharacterized protein YabE (DUF348 family)/3D (Asp-Asp-Asp) domain-containing protein